MTTRDLVTALDPHAPTVPFNAGGAFADIPNRASELSFDMLALTPEALPQDVIGRDERLRVTDTREAPWRMVCHLLIQNTRGVMHTGTGWLAGPSTIFTAGHNLLNHSKGHAASRVAVFPGRNAAQAPHGQWVTTAFDVHPLWRVHARTEVDVGVVWLPQPLDHRFGWFGFSVQPNNILRGLRVRCAGYPDDKRPFGAQWFADSRIDDAQPQLLSYGLDTMPGQSGSPVFALDAAGRAVAVGVHVGGAVTENLAVRITAPIFEVLNAWWR